MRKLLLTAIAMLGLCSVFAQTEMTTSKLKSLYQTQSRAWKSVHDPSVVWDASSQTFYIYGSHYYGVKTKDFKTYSDITNYYKNSYTAANAYKAFQGNPTHTVKRCLPGSTVEEEVTLGSFDAGAFCATYASSVASWVQGDQWAPDIVYNPHMNKWCYYLSLNGDNWASVIVLMTSDSPTGPFTYQAPIVFGGFDGQTRSGKSVNYKDTDLEIVLGAQSSLPSRYKTNQWGSYYPNCIDPCVFFDEDGELWLAYGSWSGGIFMLKLDKTTGLRDYTCTYSGTDTSPNAQALSDAYFGKKIAGGHYVSGEGPYIQHMGNYYYLFMSYGGFAPDGGYEIRVFRSDKPDGPYKDAAGTAATYTDAGKWILNYGLKATTNRGMKLIGAMNNWGLMKVGECAQGHNSACQDDKGRSFLVCHTKFNDGTLGHQIRVYQLFLNKQGWLVAAPFQFNGEETTDEVIATTQPWSASDIEGDYHLIRHPYKLDHEKMQEVTPSTVHLSADGKVTGDYTGTWAYTDEGKSYFRLSVKAAGSSATYIYNGVLTEQTLEGSTAKVLCFTTVCSASGAECGVPVWGYKMQPPYALSYNYLQNTDKLKGRMTRSNVDIMFAPVENTTLTWTSSHPDIISNTGKYTPQSETVSGITMTARMECGNYYWQSDFNFTARPAVEVTGDPTSSVVAFYNFDESALTNLYNPSESATTGRSNVTTGTRPSLEDDYSRFGQVIHQYFGANGNNSYCRIPNPLQGQTDLDGFTVSLWVKRDDNNRYDALWSFFNATSAAAKGARLFFTGNSYIGFNDNAGNWFDVNYPEKNDSHSTTSTYKAVDKIVPGEWHLVTFTYSLEEGYRLYLDGVAYTSSNLIYTGSAAASEFDRSKVMDLVTSAKYFYLGLGSFWGSAPASFDDLLIYNRALSSADVQGLNTLLNQVNDFDTGAIVGIEDIATDRVAPSVRTGIYDLTGRKVEKPGRGIYIRNGKKLWLK